MRPWSALSATLSIAALFAVTSASATKPAALVSAKTHSDAVKKTMRELDTPARRLLMKGGKRIVLGEVTTTQRIDERPFDDPHGIMAFNIAAHTRVDTRRFLYTEHGYVAEHSSVAKDVAPEASPREFKLVPTIAPYYRSFSIRVASPARPVRDLFKPAVDQVGLDGDITHEDAWAAKLDSDHIRSQMNAHK
jgi:hypothetical protein